MRDECVVGGEILNEKNGVGETNDEGEVFGTGYDLLHEVGSCALLELEALGDGITGIDDEAEPQR